MRNFLTGLVLALGIFTTVKAQDPVILPRTDSLAKHSLDTLPAAPYINEGKIAGKKAISRSLIFPGLGQLYNYGLVVKDIRSGRYEGKRIGDKLFIIGKIGAIYAGGTMLVKSYIENNDAYNKYLKELQYRSLNKDEPLPGNGLERVNTQSLYTAKSIAKNNREVVLISIAGLYGINVLDAYVSARLRYVNVDDQLAIKFSPTLIPSSSMYGYQMFTPALKLTLRL